MKKKSPCLNVVLTEVINILFSKNDCTMKLETTIVNNYSAYIAIHTCVNSIISLAYYLFPCLIDFFLLQGKKRWVHRFSEHFEPSSLTCISAGQSLVALGTKNGKIHVYESSSEFKCLRLTAILAHHNGAIHTILFQDGRILSGSDDM